MSMIKCCSKFRKLLALVRILKMNDKMNGIPYFGTFGDNFVTQVIQCYLFSSAVTHHFVIRLFSQSHISQNNNFLLLKKLTDTSQGLHITHMTVKAKDHLVINQSLTTYLQLVNVQIFTKKIIRKKYLTFL